MRITVNGEPRDIAPDATLSTVIDDVAEGHPQVAVAVNGEVVERSRWDAAALADGDRIEVVAAIQGGR